MLFTTDRDESHFTVLINRVQCVLLRKTAFGLLITGSHSPEMTNDDNKAPAYIRSGFQKMPDITSRSPAEAMETF